MQKSIYWKFGGMILTSMIVMFGIMYLNSYSLDHATFSETRFYMTFVMGAAMAVVMLSFMLNMYKSSKINIAICSFWPFGSFAARRQSVTRAG